MSISIPGYVKKALLRFGINTPTKPQDSPHPFSAPVYGRKEQTMPTIPDEPEISEQDMKFIEQVLGTFLYYGQAEDPTMLLTINVNACAKKHGMKNTLDAVMQFLEYAVSHPDSKITYHATDMILKIHTDASYLSELEARS